MTLDVWPRSEKHEYTFADMATEHIRREEQLEDQSEVISILHPLLAGEIEYNTTLYDTRIDREGPRYCVAC